MKKYFLISLMVLLGIGFVFSSCSKDKDEISNKDIVGLWHFVDMTSDIENPTNPSLAKEERDMMTFASVFMSGSTIKFESNKTFTLKIVNETIAGTYSNSGSKFTMTINGETLSDIPLNGASVTIKNDVLTITTPQDLDEEYTSYSGITMPTYRQAGFTKYVLYLNFKK